MDNNQIPAPMPMGQEVPSPSPVSPAPPMPVAPAPVEGDAPPAPPPAAPPPSADTMVVAKPPKKGISKKFILILLVLFMLLGVVGVVIGVVLPKVSQSTGEVNLTWWGLWEDAGVVEPLIAEYQQSHPNVTITYQKQSKEDYRERLDSTLSQGTGPDIFRIHNTWIPMFYAKLAPADAVVSAGEFSQTFYPVASSDLVISGEVLAMPLMYDALALYVNDELLATFGKSAPSTWSDLVETATTATVKDSSVITQAGVAMGITSNVDHWSEILALLMLQNRASLSNPNDASGLGAGAIGYFKQFADKKLWDSTLPNSTFYFASGKLAMYFGPTWEYHEIKAINPNLRFSVVPVPQVPKVTPDEPNITYATYWVEGVSKTSEHSKEAWEFLKFLSSQESLRKLYAAESQSRQFGEAYPRVDMKDEMLANPVLKSIIKDAPDAQSWYMADKTQDGKTGLNTLLSQYYGDAINGAGLESAAAGITQVLTNYGISR